MGYWAPNSIAEVLQYVASPVSAGTTTVNSGTTLVLINNASLLAAYNVVFPSNPVDGQRLIIASNAAITLMGMTGGTINGILASFSLSGFARYNFSLNAGAWFRTG